MTTSVFAPRACASCSTPRASASLVRLLMITFAPRAANSRMIARPMLRPEPVTRIVLPVKSRSLSIAMHCPLCCVVGPRAHWRCRPRLPAGMVQRARPPRRHELPPTAPDGVRLRLRPRTPSGADHVFASASYRRRWGSEAQATHGREGAVEQSIRWRETGERLRCSPTLTTAGQGTVEQGHPCTGSRGFA